MYSFNRFDVREPGVSDAAHLHEFESDEGKYVGAEEAIRREAFNASMINGLKTQLAAAHAVGSKTEHVRATALFAQLRKLADDAWPKGPLRANRNLNWAYPQTTITADANGWETTVMRFVDSKPEFSCTIGKAEYEWRNADFFAAASPEVVLFLLDHIMALGNKIQGLENAYANVAVTRLSV
jgi:hypothetical protein